MDSGLSESRSLEEFTNQELQKLIAWLKNRIASSSEPAPIQEMVLKKCEEVYLDRLNKNPRKV